MFTPTISPSPPIGIPGELGSLVCTRGTRQLLVYIARVGSLPEAVMMALAHLLPGGSLAGPTSFDLLVVGGGSAGLTAAKFAARFGKSVALIERERLGGDCTWTGCVPSKTLLASAERAHALRTAAEFGVAQPATVSVDMAAVKARIGRTIGQIYDADDSPEALRALGIETVSGAATLVDARRVSVSSGGGGTATVYEATKGVVLATGERPTLPRTPFAVSRTGEPAPQVLGPARSTSAASLPCLTSPTKASSASTLTLTLT